MGDRYIDAREASEYGRYTWARLEVLTGQTRLVAVPELRQLLLEAVEGVETEYRTTRTQQSSVRTGRIGTTEAKTDMRDVLRRFHHFIETLPAGTQVDREAFFPTQSSGQLSRLKPADLLARADEVLHGFTVPRNAALPGAGGWTADITLRRFALADSLGGKHGARHGNSLATSALNTARERFLQVYNLMAKRLVYVALTELGRLDEYRQFFLDLQVNEDRRGTSPGDEDGIDDEIDGGLGDGIDDAEPGAPAPAL
ncbi:MAG TPA: hypothetical protein VNM90_24995 [Haliangium sp.]|nr:hypothetical protein [Haliangium sp.]